MQQSTNERWTIYATILLEVTCYSTGLAEGSQLYRRMQGYNNMVLCCPSVCRKLITAFSRYFKVGPLNLDCDRMCFMKSLQVFPG